MTPTPEAVAIATEIVMRDIPRGTTFGSSWGGDHLIHKIALALTAHAASAREAGRAQGIEDAARVCDARAVKHRSVAEKYGRKVPPDEAAELFHDHTSNACRVSARAIRNLSTLPAATPGSTEE